MRALHGVIMSMSVWHLNHNKDEVNQAIHEGDEATFDRDMICFSFCQQQVLTVCL